MTRAALPKIQQMCVALLLIFNVLIPMQTAFADNHGKVGKTKRWTDVYRNPDIASGVVGAVPPDTIVTIIDDSVTNWIHIDSEYGFGWIPLSSLTDQSTPGADGGSQIEGAVVETSRWTDVFAEADAHSKVIGSLPPGASVTLIDRSGFWVSIKDGGWIPVNALAALPDIDDEPDFQGSIGRWTNLYAAPRTDADVIGGMAPGTPVTIIDRLAPNWVRVKSSDATGWVPISALADGDSEQIAGAEIIINHWTNIFASDDASSKVVGAIPPLGKAIVVQRHHFWLQITSEYGDGWIPVNAVD